MTDPRNGSATGGRTTTDEGQLVRVEGRHALRFERRYLQPIERVWTAISDPAEMARWFPSEVVGDRAVGAELTFVDDVQRAAASEAGEPTRADGPLFRGQVVVHDPPHVFSFTWGGELLRFELHPDGEGTRLVFTHVLGHRATAHRNAGGWLACLAALDRSLGLEVPADDDWEASFARAVARFGPELAVVDNGTLVWEGSTHRSPDEVRAVLDDPAAWGGDGHDGEPLEWDVDPTEHGSTFRLRHAGIDGDAALASTWHGLMIQLDMYLAAGVLLPVDAGTWQDAYARHLGG